MKYSIEQLTEHVAMLEVKRDKGLIFNLFELIACSQLIAAEARIAEYGMSPGHAHQRLCESRAARNELGFGEDADDVAPADLREAIQELRKRAEAAEAQIKELTADLDKESEIRHRIHEELNAIKGEQQPVKQLNIAGEHWMDVSDQKYRELSEELATVRTLYTHPAPALLPPEPKETDCPEWIADPFSWTCGAGWMRHQAIAMGAKPLPVIDLTALDALVGDFRNSSLHTMGSGRVAYIGCYRALAKCIKEIRAAGLEVKS